MVALVVEARSKKKGKANGQSELEMILFGYYIKFRPGISGVTHIFWNKWLQHGEQVNRNFGINHFYPKIGGHVFTPKFGKKNARTEASKIVSSRNRLYKDRYQLIWTWY